MLPKVQFQVVVNTFTARGFVCAVVLATEDLCQAIRVARQVSQGEHGYALIGPEACVMVLEIERGKIYKSSNFKLMSRTVSAPDHYAPKGHPIICIISIDMTGDVPALREDWLHPVHEKSQHKKSKEAE